jgi:hypothetical protein
MTVSRRHAACDADGRGNIVIVAQKPISLGRRWGLIVATVAVVLALLTEWWLPNLVRLLFQVGLTIPMAVAGDTIQMEKSWFPVRSSEQGIWRLTSKNRPTIVLARAPTHPFEEIRYVFVSKVTSDEVSILDKSGQQVNAKKFSWGTAVLLSDGRVALLKDYGLVISDDDSPESYLSTALEDIRSIRAQSVKASN